MTEGIKHVPDDITTTTGYYTALLTELERYFEHSDSHLSRKTMPDTVAAALKLKITNYLHGARTQEPTRDKPFVSPVLLANALIQKTQDRLAHPAMVLRNWILDNSKYGSIEQTYTAHAAYTTEHFQEEAVGHIATSADGNWELVQHKYPEAIYRMGKVLGGLCIDKTEKDVSRIFQEAADSEINNKNRRPSIEIYAVRPVHDPNNADHTFLFSYTPQSQSIIDAEGKKKGRVSSFIDYAQPYAKAFFEFVRRTRTGDIPNMYVRTMFNMDHYLETLRLPGPPVTDVLLYDGTLLPLEEAVAQSISSTECVAGGILKVTKDVSLLDLAKIAETYPITLDMTDASQEQKDALVHVRGSIQDNAEYVSYQNLQSVGYKFESACKTYISLPNLNTLHLLQVHGAKSTNTPQLRNYFIVFIAKHASIYGPLDPARVVRVGTQR